MYIIHTLLSVWILLWQICHTFGLNIDIVSLLRCRVIMVQVSLNCILQGNYVELDSWSDTGSGWTIIMFLGFLRGNCTLKSKIIIMSCAILKLSIPFWKTIYASYVKLSEELIYSIKIEVSLDVLELLIKTIFRLFCIPYLNSTAFWGIRNSNNYVLQTHYSIYRGPCSWSVKEHTSKLRSKMTPDIRKQIAGDNKINLL